MKTCRIVLLTIIVISFCWVGVQGQLNISGNPPLPLAYGGTNATTATAAATSLGLGTGNTPTFSSIQVTKTNSPNITLTASDQTGHFNLNNSGTNWEFGYDVGDGGSGFYFFAGAYKLKIYDNGNVLFHGTPTAPAYATSANCSSSASPAVCGAAAAGSFTIAAGATSIVVNTSAVTTNSQVLVTEDSSLGTKLSVTCNTQSTLVIGSPSVSARSNGVSFTVILPVGPTATPACYSYSVIN